VLGTVHSGPDAVRRCRRDRPDVLVLDLGLPGMNGFEVLERLEDLRGEMKVLVVTGSATPEAVLRCMRMGVQGLREKTSRVEEISAAVEEVARGRSAYTREHERAAQSLLGDLARRSREAAAVSTALTKREREILQLMVRGHGNRQCARALGITERTVESHLFGLYSKLGATSRIGAVQRALQLHLVDLEQVPAVALDPA
jgi:DNA-binding NarL/FixJ family response regulator